MAESADLSGTLRREYVKCGKVGCKRCNSRGHGPYWYSYYRVEGKLRKRYIGTWLPREYEHLLSDIHEPVAYYRAGTYFHKECLAALGYHGANIDTYLKEAHIVKAHATLRTRQQLCSSYCGQCGKSMKELSG